MADETNTPAEMTAEYVASVTRDTDVFDKLPLEEKERITKALADGIVTDEMLEAVPEAGDPPPAAAEKTAEELAAEDAAKTSEPKPDPEPEEEPEVAPQIAVAEAKKKLRATYNEAVTALKADIEATEPSDKYSDDHEEWARKRNAAMSKRSDLRDELDGAIEEVETKTYAEVHARTAGNKASIALLKAAEADPMFTAGFKIKDVAATVTKVYQPWLARVVKANGGDPTVQADVEAAWARFHADPEFAKHEDIKSPENLKDVLIAATAYDGVTSRGLSPEAAIVDAAVRNGVLGEWRHAAAEQVRLKHEADLKAQTTSTQAALARRGQEESPPAGSGSGPLAPASQGAPVDLDTANEWMEGYFARKDAAAARGKGYKMDADEAKIHKAAEDIILRNSAPGAAVSGG